MRKWLYTQSYEAAGAVVGMLIGVASVIAIKLQGCK